ncbi:ABC transporter ATP-binding protein [Isoptericola sp. b441]|uniref:ABC transporter ATP-binding protein n=1 Tax=Actinotalea lenta TaxID=3064654 RepID=A0ABT9DCG0_9CELL|nr:MULTISPECIES: ABC transporter ATP-binding protein [unclassified Isoptericola]MDO8106991.1 ABC transporter ATP-binding protein [Isoptericola sp. b441]MDO8121299.1 ABC transporter ATP-binding protein [Isoptericola sp. b490]
MTDLLEAHGYSHRYGSLLAVDDVTMRVGPGEVVGLLGANGAGKTTLIRALLGLIGSADGQIRLLGGAPSRQNRRRVGYVPQGLGLYDDLTVAENLQFTAQAYDVPVPDLPQDLAPHSRTLVGALALGSQRRLAFVCALLHSPEVLVLDEPTSGVDPLARARLWDTVREHAERGVGVLVTTHYMQEAQQCDRLLLMAGGRLVGQGSEADVVAGTTAVEVRTERWAQAFAALQSAGAAVTLAGRSVRVADGDPDRLRAALDAAGVVAQIVSVPATIEERMAVLARGAT